MFQFPCQHLVQCKSPPSAVITWHLADVAILILKTAVFEETYKILNETNTSFITFYTLVQSTSEKKEKVLKRRFPKILI